MKKNISRGVIGASRRETPGHKGQKRAAKVRARKLRASETWSPPLHGPGTAIETEAKI